MKEIIEKMKVDVILKGYCGHCENLSFEQKRDLSGLRNSCPHTILHKGSFIPNCKKWSVKECLETDTPKKNAKKIV